MADRTYLAPSARLRPNWPAALFGTAACAVAILVARGSEVFLGLNPCAFCLLERWPYYIGAALGLVCLVLPRAPARAGLWLLAVVLLTGAGLSFVHTGVERHWWPDPLPACRAPDFSGMTMAQRIAAMPARPAKPCEDPDYLIPGVPVSMAEMGVLYALGCSAGLAFLLAGSRKQFFFEKKNQKTFVS